ncbi:MAG: FkbM family methyltransferase [Opitutae bacterium]|nr:FkbM family methyltransferase [Opitutae bacterium]
MSATHLLGETLRKIIGAKNHRALVAYRQARQQARNEQKDDAQRAALYRRWIAPGQLVFDLGANLGNRARVFAGLGARVVAVEPQPHCHRALRWQFALRPRVKVVGAAVGRDNTPQTMTQFDSDVLSSLSPDWIAAAKASGRFGELTDLAHLTVPCVTLDQLIAAHGVPAFTKIDVEGYEAEVLAGLSQPCGTVSLEVTPELPAVAEACLDKLAALGYAKFQLSLGESMELSEHWSDLAAFRARLRQFAADRGDFGDVYALAPGRSA